MTTLSNEQLDCLEQYAEANGAVGSLKDLFDLIAQARRANELDGILNAALCYTLKRSERQMERITGLERQVKELKDRVALQEHNPGIIDFLNQPHIAAAQEGKK